jgi:hypothetical protein
VIESWSYAYDGDGNRVKGAIGGVTTVYIGNHFEWTGSTSTMKKYYYAGATRVVMRTGTSTINYLLGDHLGSTAITANSSGVKSAEIRYYPWGTERYTSGTTPTTFKYTGQRAESGLGPYFTTLAGTTCACTVHQRGFGGAGAGNPQAWDRYAYTLNNPLRYTDPSGHDYCDSPHADPEECADDSIEIITQEDVETLWDPDTVGYVADTEAAELAFLHYLTDPGYFVMLYANPAAWASSEEVANLDVFLQYSSFHVTSNELLNLGFVPDVAGNLSNAHMLYGAGDYEGMNAALLAAGAIPV